MNENTIIGTIVEAGDDDACHCRLVIHTKPSELKKLTTLPLYQPVMITLKALPELP